MIEIVNMQSIQNQIFTYRNTQVMVDRDLAIMFGVETRVLNQAVKRNSERFPEAFRFQLNEVEFENWKSQIVISNESSNTNLISQFVISSDAHGGIRKFPYVFTEQGVAMLSAVLKSQTAIQISIQVINAFVAMRKTINLHSGLLQRMDTIELKQIKSDQKFEQIFKALEIGTDLPKQGIF